jgi:hypothetical protein
LRKEHVLLHSCAFRYRGAGTVVAGWQKGGKTEMLLAFMAAGAQYLADEWTIISPDGRTVYGLPGIVQIWSWHLRHVPPYWKRLRRSERARLRLLRLYQRLYREMPEVGGTTDFPLAALHRLSLEGGNPLIGQVRSSPERLFGDHVSHAPSPLNRLFLATSWEGATTVRPLTGADLAHRMVSSLEWERRELMAAYDQFKYAFPDRRNDWIENAAKREHEILSRAFSSKLAHEVLHPYPVPLQDLHAVTAPLYE